VLRSRGWRSERGQIPKGETAPFVEEQHSRLGLLLVVRGDS
jgi:hypothetical protein